VTAEPPAGSLRPGPPSASPGSGARGADWRPSASVERLRLRAGILARIRDFFARRGVLEVETPCMASTTATDPHVHSLRTEWPGPGAAAPGSRWLQPSPEFAMKRLLAAGSGPIFQLGRAFRDGERGRLHAPEFTLLEWYRPGFDHHALMDEAAALLAALGLAGAGAGTRLEYPRAFEAAAGLDPLSADEAALRERAAALGVASAARGEGFDRDACLDAIFALAVQPSLPPGAVFVHAYPASQAALARLSGQRPETAERFELFLDRVEIANGYHELTDAAEQRRRLEADRAARARRGLPVPPADERLLAALEHGLPACAGVALGVDRLVMLAAGASHIDEVVAFPVERA